MEFLIQFLPDGETGTVQARFYDIRTYTQYLGRFFRG